MLFLYSFLLLPAIGWAIAEFKAPLRLRLLIGAFALVVVAVVSFQTASVKPALENEDLRACLDEVRSAFSKGEFEKIEEAYRAYEADVRQGRGEYQSRRVMLMTLRARQP